MPKLSGVNQLQAVRALEKAGFWIIRQGKHIVMSDGTRILTIPRHNPVNSITMGGFVQLPTTLPAIVNHTEDANGS